MFTGAEDNENDILTGVILENGTACPPICGSPNNLNS
jgi:hypothetical protein